MPPPSAPDQRDPDPRDPDPRPSDPRDPDPRPSDQRSPDRREFLGRLSLPERTFVTDALRTETVGGVLLLLATVLALVLANTTLRETYETWRTTRVGPAALHLDLTLAQWAMDGLLSVFFFVAGIELKRELTTGELRDPRAAALPVSAALCGMAVPALVYTVCAGVGGGELRGWAVPMATDIAFALGVLAVLGTGLPSALRAFLLTLAVVDDLGAIIVIAVFYSDHINAFTLLGALAGLVLFWFLHRRGVRGWWWYVPLALVIWALMHEAGVHATVAGVAMGLLLRCHRREGEKSSPAEHIEHLVRPLSAGLAVPLFALFAAGVPVSGGALRAVFTGPETLGIVLGLVVGKTVGVFGGTWLTARFTRARLNPDLAWADVLALAALSGIGFTVSLLIAELAFTGEELTRTAKAAVLVGSLLAVVLAAVLLKLRARRYRALVEEEERDEDHDGIPDIYEQDDPGYHLRMARLYEAKAAEHRRLAAAGAGTRPPGDGDPASSD